MSDFELSGLVDFDVSELTGGAEDASDSLEGLADESDEASESLIELDAKGAAAGGALAGLGTGMQKAMDDTQDLREELNRAGQAAGFTQDEMVDLATGLSDATFSTEDATGALGALAEQGVDTEAELERLASTSDDIADATGESATVVAEDLGPAMAAVGDDISEMDEIADGVVATINETNLEFNDFTRTVERSREELNEMGLSTDETATLMGEFAEETGLSGRELRREFSSELEDADGDLGDFADSTGINIDSQADLQAALAESQGATDSYSEAVSENTTLMDELRAGVSDATLQFADMLGPVSAAAPALQALGGAAITLSTINFSAVVPSLAAVSAAAAPITAIVLGLAAAAAILWKAWESNFLNIQGVTEDVLGALGDGFGWLRETVGDAIDNVIDAVFQIPSAIGEAIDTIPGIDSDDVLGRVDTESIRDSMFPDKPGEEGEDVGEAMGGGATKGVDQTADISSDRFVSDDIDPEAFGEEIGEDIGSGVSTGVSSSADLEGIVESLEPDDVVENLSGEREALESELEALRDEGGGPTENLERRRELVSEIEDLDETVEDVDAAEDITEIDTDLVADTAESQLAEERADAEAINEIFDELDERDLETDIPDVSSELPDADDEEIQTAVANEQARRSETPRRGGDGDGRLLKQLLETAKQIRTVVESPQTIDVGGGEIEITGDNATIQDVQAELRRAGRESDLRGTL